MSDTPQLTPALFTLLAGLVEERTGMHYAERDSALFGAKLLARVAEAGFASALDYYYFLRYDDADRREFDSLAEMLTVHETYFFREAEQLRALCDQVLRPVVAAGGRARVWCAAASTGEEPLTLAMLLDDRGMLDSVDILATDISGRALQRAEAGRYGGRSLRALEGRQVAQWLAEAGADRVVRPPLRRTLRYQRLNLMDAPAVAKLGTFHAILCRNVLIYFSDATVRQLLACLAGALCPGGVILVGASESLLRFGTMLVCEERGGAFFYRSAGS
ncbi:MAG: protein-glutamate O-methyltransferase CheR [Polyangiaceae bacterium]